MTSTHRTTPRARRGRRPARLAAALLLVALSVGLAAGPAAASCGSSELAGTWERADGAAVWRFAGDGSLACEGDCRGIAGQPLAFALLVPKSRVILQDLFGLQYEYARILFSDGAADFGCAMVGSGLQLTNWEQGTLVFRRPR